MFLGTHTPRLDAKGRLALPARFRTELASGLVLAKGQERCLTAYPMDEFLRVTDALKAAPIPARGARDWGRVFFASASQEVPDAQGRITVPPALREYAGLTKDCVVIGANTRVEIWDATAWQTYLTDREEAFADAGEEVFAGRPAPVS